MSDPTYAEALEWAIDRAGDAERDDIIGTLSALAEYVQEARLDDDDLGEG